MTLRCELKQFPLICTFESSPEKMGVVDVRGLRTPVYNYGWIVPFQQLADPAKETLGRVPRTLQGSVSIRWKMFGYAEKYGPGMRPQLQALRDRRAEAVLVYIASNDSPEKIKSAVSDDAFREACRECVGNPQAVQQDALWFRRDIDVVPEGYDYEFEVYPGFRHFTEL